MSKPMSIIFISYCREDNNVDFINTLKQKLSKWQYTVFQDMYDIPPGEDWKVEIDQNIDSSLALLLVVTERTPASQYVTYEWSRAVAKNVAVIPIVRDMKAFDKLHKYLHIRNALIFDQPDDRTRPWTQLQRRLKDLEKLRSLHTHTAPMPAPKKFDESDIFVGLEEIIKSYTEIPVTTSHIINGFARRGLITPDQQHQILNLIRDNEIAAKLKEL